MIERQMCSFFPSYLEGSVESWYHSVSETVQSSLQLIKEALFKRFRPSQLSVELKDINQGDGETVDVDVHRVLRLCADASLTGISLLNQDNERPEASTSECCDTPGSCKYGGLTSKNVSSGNDITCNTNAIRFDTTMIYLKTNNHLVLNDNHSLT